MTLAAYEDLADEQRFSARTIVWLAAYPKSGTTWVRALLGALAAGGEVPDLDSLPGRPLAFERHRLDDHAAISSAEYSVDELIPLQASLHRALARSGRPPFLIKTHSAFVRNSAGEALFRADASRGAIYVVRNPLDVAPSYAHHLGCSLDDAVALLAASGSVMEQWPDRAGSNVPQIVGSWSENVESWLSQAAFPLLLVRYEDMIRDTATEFARICAFLGIAAENASLRPAIDAASFERLQRREVERGFVEKPNVERRFFREGRSGTGACTLTSAQVESICRVHGRAMEKLGYS